MDGSNYESKNNIPQLITTYKKFPVFRAKKAVLSLLAANPGSAGRRTCSKCRFKAMADAVLSKRKGYLLIKPRFNRP